MDDLTKLINFWNSNFQINKDEKIEIEDYRMLAPSKKLYDSLVYLANKNNILDYGTGHGWASIILAKENASNIKAVDMAPNAIKAAIYFSEYFQVNDKINFQVIDNNYINNENKLYDGIFCSNVLDVIPEDETNKILEFFNRIANKDAIIIIGLNYYLDISNKDKMKDLKIVDHNVYIDNILRLVSKTDEAWANLFSKWFQVIKLEHFAWNGEENERRRLFYLKKRTI